MDPVNPEEGTVEAAAVRLLQRRQQRNSPPEEANPPEAEPEDEVDQDETEEVEIEEDETAEDEDSQETPTYTVKVHGEEVAVTLDELRSGYMFEADYRKKTASVAEERKKVEELHNSLLTNQSQYLQKLEILNQVIGAKPFSDEQLAELKARPEDYIKAKEANERHAERLSRIQSETENVTQQLTQAQKEALDKKKRLEAESLLAVLPELNEAENEKQLVGYIMELGFTPKDIESTLDHRIFVLAEKARRYDALKAKGKSKPKPDTPKVGGKAPRRDKSGETAVKKVQEARSRLKNSGDIRDATQLLLTRRKQRK